ncbi:GNAT family N-acetyltransferase [Streptomyces sp. HPF1205]|uniref:GNAT family N-acetyltransferase n=1 Tax=Streptomyces sp. HPF1205 TaxID=2873262 RepID=UPI001CEDDE4D|nr:GNAT family N-acetyltransferase [Streptomyces sp. HPF1205]
MTVVIGSGAPGSDAFDASGASGGPRGPGGRWYVEPAGPRDRAGLEALFASCSPETVRLRFFGLPRAFPRPYVDDALAGRPDLHDAVVGHRGDRSRPVGLAGLVARPHEEGDGSGGHRVAELAVLVADDWQRRGLGGAMTGTLLTRARDRGVTRVAASVLPHRAALLAALGRRPELVMVGGSVTRDARTGVYRLL